MSRTVGASQGEFIYPVLNRGNAGSDVFHKDEGFAAFVRLMRAAHDKVPMRLVGYCLMPNHFHLMLCPLHDGDLIRWMRWLMTSHVHRYHRHYESRGHVWGGRFKAFPVQDNSHYLTMFRYSERNPLRARLVERSQDWGWSSLKSTCRSGRSGLLCGGPVPKQPQWTQFVNAVETASELHSVRRRVQRESPNGKSDRQRITASTLGLESSLRPRSRPGTQ